MRSIYWRTVALCLFVFGLESITVGENGQNDFTMIVLPDTQNYVAGFIGALLKPSRPRLSGSSTIDRH